MLLVHDSAGWNELPMHTAVKHGVPDAICSQPPLPSHLPSLPQVAAVHWLPGAVMPDWMLAQVPSFCPVRALVHAMQVPPQVWSQQMPPTQCPLLHLSLIHI